MIFKREFSLKKGGTRMRSTEEKIKRKVISVVIIVAILSTMAGCGKSQSRKEPITLTIWHVYGGQTDSPLNDLIDEFNGTEGKKEGIKIQVGMVSNTNTIHEEVLKAANKDPGAAKLPDLFISYPKTVLAMNDSGILADYHDYFSENELKDFIPEFLKEGEIDGRCSTATHMHNQIREPVLIASVAPFYCKIIQFFFHIQSLPNQISIYFHLISKMQMQKLFLVYYIQLCHFLQERVSQCHPCQNAQERFL